MEDTFHEMELLSRQLNHTHRAAVQWELNAAGLSEVNHPMLLTILESGREDKDQVANSLNSLEKSGYIRREPGQRDARRNRVSLTDKGIQAVSGCREAFQRVAARMLSGFSEEEYQQLAQFQRRMLCNLLDSQPKE